MSEWAIQKEAFLGLVIAHGIVGPEDMTRALPLGYSVPEARLHKWLRNLKKVSQEFCSQKRYINRFKVGADPEFVFETLVPGMEATIAPASALGLAQGPAFGADNNGRLVEIRPFPSRSTLEVCASLLAAMRWMTLIHPETLTMRWLSGGFLFGDGVGGHVHFGRKRPTRREEVAALDNIGEAMVALGMYPAREVLLRRRGDTRGQRYGLLGDFRLQNHGYEYRTFPSWLDSPELAFLALTLSKLAVHNPRLAALIKATGNRQQLLNYLAYFKDMDDDARLAYVVASRSWVQHVGGDFKGRWGLTGMGKLNKGGRVEVIPLAIKPSGEDTQEMFEYLLRGTPLLARRPVPTWAPLTPPKGYHMCLPQTSTHQQKGLGEMVWDLCYHERMVVYLGGASRDTRQIMIPRGLCKFLPKDWRDRFPKGAIKDYTDEGKFVIYIPLNAREAPWARKVKQALVDLFPLWRVGKVEQGSYEAWLKKATESKPKEKTKFSGKILWQTERMEV